MLMILFYRYIGLLYRPGGENFQGIQGRSGITLYVVIDSGQTKSRTDPRRGCIWPRRVVRDGGCHYVIGYFLNAD